MPHLATNGALLRRRGWMPAVLIVAHAALLHAALLHAAQAHADDAPRPRPNILLAIADDWSFGHASAYGCAWVRTPAFDRVARRGILFTRAYTPNAKCAPSRACLLTGRNSWQLKEAANHICYFPPEFRTYPEALAAHGYFVGHTGKGWGPGVAHDTQGQPRAMTGRAFNRRQAQPPARAMSNNDYAANFADFLDAAPPGQPWCFWYGAAEPHRAYEYGIGAARGKKLSDIDRVPGYWPDNETVRHDLLDYAVEVEHFDAHLGRMLQLLEERQLLDNTLVVVTSDHGMPFPRCKGQTYDASNHVPLAVAWPQGIAAPGRTVDDYVSFIDLAPTFLQVAGVDWEASGMAPTPGRSLCDIFQTPRGGQIDPQRDHVLLGKERHDVGRPQDVGYPIRGIVCGDWLYLRNFEPQRWPAGNPETGYLNCDGSPCKSEVLRLRREGTQPRYWELCFGRREAEELYDLAADPDCLNNLAGRAEHQQRMAQLKQRLFDGLRAQHDPRILGNGEVFDRYPYANAATRNFYERYLRGEKVRAGWVNESDFEPRPLD
jgi:N-sulfoglucosamine sulfohydrolase